MPQIPQQTRRRMQGFSITELMVSVGIIVLLIGISYPFLSALNRGSRVEAGLNIAGMSSDVARQWVQAVSWANDGSTAAPTLESYTGTAAIYCPTGEVRIVVNDRTAQASNGTPAFLEDRGRDVNGYRDLSQVEYIQIPDGVGIAGIYKDPNTSGVVTFIAPPFAVAYNELGQLYYGDTGGYIYYDADRNTQYNTGDTRPNNYNPTQSNEDNASISSDGVSLELPFEAIECVPGIVIYSLNEFEAAGFDFSGGGQVTLASNEGQWLQDNGETIFFSPHTGAALRDEQQ
ncbi:MAG: hypothetical protein AAF085_16360, partial [Planctomycetota bacterium]